MRVASTSHMTGSGSRRAGAAGLVSDSGRLRTARVAAAVGRAAAVALDAGLAIARLICGRAPELRGRRGAAPGRAATVNGAPGPRAHSSLPDVRIRAPTSPAATVAARAAGRAAA